MVPLPLTCLISKTGLVITMKEIDCESCLLLVNGREENSKN
jgi:hypothetical protein